MSDNDTQPLDEQSPELAQLRANGVLYRNRIGELVAEKETARRAHESEKRRLTVEINNLKQRLLIENWGQEDEALLDDRLARQHDLITQACTLIGAILRERSNEIPLAQATQLLCGELADDLKWHHQRCAEEPHLELIQALGLLAAEQDTLDDKTYQELLAPITEVTRLKSRLGKLVVEKDTMRRELQSVKDECDAATKRLENELLELRQAHSLLRQQYTTIALESPYLAVDK